MRARWLVLAALPAAAQQLQFVSLGDLRLESGEVVRDCRIGYRAFGRLNGDKSNAILFPTWFTGTSQQLADSIGPGKLADPARWYVLAVDALGNGVSSAPSNSKLQPRMRFPRFTIRDMVESQRRLLERLGIRHLRAVMGTSMGGMQTFQWMAAYPDFMDLAVPIVGTPRLTSYDLLLWNAEARAIEGSADWRNGDYTAPPAAAMRTVADIHALALTTPESRVRETAAAQFPAFLAATEKKTLEGFDANDWLRQLQAMIGHDISRPFGGDMARAAQAVKAKTLVVVALDDHMVNPEPALTFARLIRAATLELDSDCGHLAVGCEEPRVAPRVAQFLRTGQ